MRFASTCDILFHYKLPVILAQAENCAMFFCWVDRFENHCIIQKNNFSCTGLYRKSIVGRSEFHRQCFSWYFFISCLFAVFVNTLLSKTTHSVNPEYRIYAFDTSLSIYRLMLDAFTYFSTSPPCITTSVGACMIPNLLTRS